MIYYFHEDDNYSENSSREYNLYSGLGEHKYKIKSFIKYSAYQALEQKLKIAVAALERTKKHSSFPGDNHYDLGKATTQALELIYPDAQKSEES